MLSPKFLDGRRCRRVGAEQDGRAVLAEWLTSKDNPFLARAAVNRIWSHLLGRGIIDPVDDIRSSNPPSNAALLDALAKDFVEHDFDQRRMLRTILNSRTYQLAARTLPSNAADKQNFSHFLPRRLTAEQWSIRSTRSPARAKAFKSRIPGAGTVALPVTGLRASQVPDRLLTSASARPVRPAARRIVLHLRTQRRGEHGARAASHQRQGPCSTGSTIPTATSPNC